MNKVIELVQYTLSCSQVLIQLPVAWSTLSHTGGNGKLGEDLGTV